MINHRLVFKISTIPVFLGAILIGLTGCATIMTGQSQELSFKSVPEGALVTINGKDIGRTPITTTLKKKSDQSVTFQKDGYKPLTLGLETRLNSWFWGNIVLGGFFGSTTDGIAGGVYEYSPGQYLVNLEASGLRPIEARTVTNNRDRVVQFIVSGYPFLKKDIATGQGEYLSSLLGLLQINPANREEAISRIRGLSMAYPDILEFAEHVADAFVPRGEQSTMAYSRAPVSAPIVKSKAEKIRALVSNNGDAIDSEIVKGKGAYLGTLFSILEIPKEKQPLATQRLNKVRQEWFAHESKREDFAKSKNYASLADRILEEFKIN